MRYWPLTAVLLAFWMGRETGAGDNGSARVGKFDSLEVGRVVLKSGDDGNTYTTTLSNQGLHVRHVDGYSTSVAPHGLLVRHGGNLVATVNGSTGRITVRGKDGAVRAVLGRATTYSEKTDTMVDHPASTLTLYDAKGKVLAQLPQEPGAK